MENSINDIVEDSLIEELFKHLEKKVVTNQEYKEKNKDNLIFND